MGNRGVLEGTLLLEVELVTAQAESFEWTASDSQISKERRVEQSCHRIIDCKKGFTFIVIYFNKFFPSIEYIQQFAQTARAGELQAQASPQSPAWSLPHPGQPEAYNGT